MCWLSINILNKTMTGWGYWIFIYFLGCSTIPYPMDRRFHISNIRRWEFNTLMSVYNIIFGGSNAANVGFYTVPEETLNFGSRKFNPFRILLSTIRMRLSFSHAVKQWFSKNRMKTYPHNRRLVPFTYTGGLTICVRDQFRTRTDLYRINSQAKEGGDFIDVAGSCN